ncbi:MAG: ABC transporter substrate-binding protein [Candidatus Geothermarchaeales archaeon]
MYLAVALVIGLAAGYFIYPSVNPTTEEELQQALDDANARISDLQGDVSGLQEDVSDLQATIDAFPTLEGTIPIGALLSLTGDLATFGENEYEALKIARDEVNQWLTDSGYDFQIEVIPEDTATTPALALEKLQSLAAQGVKVVLGPLASSEVRAIKAYADANDILVLSQSSTDPGIAIAGDNVFRYTTDDTIQGPVMAAIAESVGLTHVVPVWRRDTWGDGLIAEARKAMEDMDITVAAGIGYDPEVVGTTGFGAEVDSLNSAVEGLVATHGVDNVGVLFIAFEEAVDMLAKASEFPGLEQVKWIGSDGTAVSAAVSGDPTAAEFAVTTEWTNPIFGVTHSAKWEKLRDQIHTILGRDPDPYSYNMYDMLWIVAQAIVSAGEYDFAKIKAVLPQISNNFFGASGWTILNEAGDRAGADYELYEVVPVDGLWEWEQIGIYTQSTGEITWY